MAERTLGETTAANEDPAPGQDVRAPAPQLYRVLDCERPLAACARHSLAAVDLITVGRGEHGAGRGDGRQLALTLPDRWVSTHHAQLRRLLGRWVIEDQGSRNGTLVNGAPVESAPLADGDWIELGHTFYLFRDAVPTPVDEPLDLELAAGEPALTTLSAPLARDLAALRRVARAPVSVIVHGETGTGKELVARALHALSGRAGEFVALNCGAMPETLVETELFGYRKGAFSDAREDRTGLVRTADGGTLFLDEVGALPLPMQTAFLRVLQEREVLPVGGTRPVAVDLRLCSASHHALDELVAAGRFRSDLLARLSGFTIRLPALRQRREDLGLLVAALTRRLAPEPERLRFRVGAARALARHAWPLNIRELENALGAAFALAGDGPIDEAHLPEAVRAGPAAASTGPIDPREASRRAELERLLDEHQGNVSAVARAMGKERAQIRRWLKRFGLDTASYK